METAQEPYTSTRELIAAMTASIETKLYGMKRPLEEILIAYMAGGHILLEDVPGVGKTALAKAVTQHLGLTFHRIQCTPDMLPSDIVGGLIYHPKDGTFHLRKGPIFANLILVDEINRALPRTQSALLEAMGEGQVTIDGETHILPQPFMVIATQNPIESQGVFPLPEAQLDRFLLKTTLGYPQANDDVRLLRAHLAPEEPPATSAPSSMSPGSGIHLLLQAADDVHISDEVLAYIAALVQATRNHKDVQIGASPRAMIMLAKASRAAAIIADRTYTIPDDVVRVLPLVLFHRLVWQGYATIDGITQSEWIQNLIESVPTPVERAVP